jgi:mannose-6-phosphate isomerase-like protein (cupin superfamily)
MNRRNSKRPSLLIDPTQADVFESPEPFRRFMRLLVDRERFPETPLTIARVQYPSGAKGPFHSHRKTTEVYFVLSGELTATVQGKRYRVKQGQLLYIPPGNEHRAENCGTMACRFMTINTPLAKDVPELMVRKKWEKVNRKNKLKG